MPIDAEIPLQVKTPDIQPPNAMQAYGNAMALQHSMQQQQLTAQQIQESQLNLQNMQREQQDNQTIRDAYIKYGGNLSQVAQATAGYVNPNKTQQLKLADIEMQTKMATLTNEQHTAIQYHADKLAPAIDSVKGETDPDKRQTLWSNVVTQAVADKAIQPGEVPADVPDNNTLEGFKAHILGIASYSKLTTEKATTAAAQARTEADNLKMAAQTVPDDPTAYQAWYSNLDTSTQAKMPATYTSDVPAKVRLMGMNPEQQIGAPGVIAKSQQEVKAALAGTLATASTYGDYQTRFNQQTRANTDGFPDFSTKNPTTPITAADRTAIRQAGLTAEQQTTSTQQAADLAERTNAANNLNSYHQQSIALRRQTAARQNTADERQANTEIAKLEATERTLNLTQGRIASAIRDGMYLTPAGKLTSLSTLTDPKDQEAARQDLLAQYAGNADNLKKVIASKYEQYGRLGVTGSMPLADVNAAIDSGTQLVMNPKKNAPPAPTGAPTPTPTPTPKPAAPTPTPTPTPTPPPPPAQKNAGQFRLMLPSGQKGPNGADSILFPDEASARKWAAAKGLTLNDK